MGEVKGSLPSRLVRLLIAVPATRRGMCGLRCSRIVGLEASVGLSDKQFVA